MRIPNQGRTLLLLMLTVAGSSVTAMENPADIRVGSLALRRSAVSAPPPAYPKESLAAGRQGMAAATVYVTVDGIVSDVNILESPDEYMAHEVQSALKLWRFRPFLINKGTTKAKASGRLVFYFKIESGKPVVYDAAAKSIRTKEDGKAAK